MVHIVWFRQDLRLHDNPAFYHACKGGVVLPVYIYDTKNIDSYTKMGGASKVWLHHSLESLNKSLDNRLHVFLGNPQDILEHLIKTHDVQAVHWNRLYEPCHIARDTQLKKDLPVRVHSYNSAILWEPWHVKKNNGEPYKIYTPYFKQVRHMIPDTTLPIPENIRLYPIEKTDSVHNLGLLPRFPAWHANTIERHWKIGEPHALEHWIRFLQQGLRGYGNGRDIPSLMHVSRLAPYLRFGEISPRKMWHAVLQKPVTEDTETFMRELAWRDFSYYQLYHTPTLPYENCKRQFDAFPWENDDALFDAWCRGRTGIPMVDAGMRELWHTGYMHNRVRMICASFLVKNLRIDWRRGERWFWDCLCDADLASNTANWQWVAGCGADAAPYFRIFNPVRQGQICDSDGTYIRTYIPELSHVSDAYIHTPWLAPNGADYPNPIVDLARSRKQTLDIFKNIFKSNT